MMKILFVTDLCPIKNGEWGLPFTLLNFIKDMKESGQEIVLLRPNVIFNVLIRKRKIYPNGIYEHCGIKCINKNFLTPFFTQSGFDILKNEDFDIIMAHMPSGILAGYEISKKFKKPFIAAVHASDIKVLNDKKYFFLRKRMKNAYIHANKAACRSIWLEDKIKTIIPEIKDKTVLIPSGIDFQEIITPFAIDKKIELFKRRPLEIFSAGSLIKRKNFDLLIKAVIKTKDVTLSIAGSGMEEKRLKKMVHKLNAEDKIRFLGQLSREEVYSKMENTPVFALVSSCETFGMVYLEALSKGCIVIAKENSGMSGFIKNGENGFLSDENVTIENLISVFEKIKTLKNPELLIKNAVKTALSMEKKKMAENYINIAKNILFKI